MCSTKRLSNGAPDGSVILSNNTNSFVGTVTVASGRSQISNAGQPGTPPNPVFVVGGMNGGGQLQDNNGNITATNMITISGLGTARDDGGSLGCHPRAEQAQRADDAGRKSARIERELTVARRRMRDRSRGHMNCGSIRTSATHPDRGDQRE